MTRPGRVLPAALGVGGLFLLALALRAWGIGWGVPGPSRYYPYHPDEAVLLQAVCSVNPLWGDVTPSFYNYGSFSILLCRLAYDLIAPLAGWGAVPRFDQPFSGWVGDLARLLLVGRGITVLLGAATIPATWALANVLFGRRAAWIAAGLLAVTPLHVTLSHYLTVDVPATFLTTLSLLAAALALRSGPGAGMIRWCAAAGIAAGLATGTKYNSFPVLLALLPALWSAWQVEGSQGRRFALMGALAAGGALIAAFLISTPGALLETDLFRRHVEYELLRNREGQGLVFRDTLPTVLYHLLISFPVGLEWPLWLLCLATLPLLFLPGRGRSAVQGAGPLLFLAVSFLLLLPAERKFLRYITPLVPPMLVLVGGAIEQLLEQPRSRPWRTGAVALAGAAALASTLAHLGVLARPDARDEAAAYLRSNTLPGDIVALGSDSYFYTPPIHPTAGAVKAGVIFGGPPIWDAYPRDTSRPDLTPVENFRVLAPPPMTGALSTSLLERYHPRYVILSDYEWEDPLRIHAAEPQYRNGILDLLAVLDRKYVVAREFRPRPALLGFTWWSRGTPPHDWRYYMPTVRVYARRS